MNLTLRAAAWILALLLSHAPIAAQPTWRPQWKYQLPPRQAAWEFTQRMPLDRAYQPLVQGDLAVVGCEHNGAVIALDLRTGEERWRFYTEAPIRTAPTGDGERFFVGSEDGRLYALDAAGKLLWIVRGGPGPRWVIGHDRLISAWPVSVRPLAHEGRVYFAAGYWPVDGIFVRCVDARDGRLLWANNGAELRPHGELRLDQGRLVLEGFAGVGVFDLATGRVLSEKPEKSAPPEHPELPGVEGQVVGRWQFGEHAFASTVEGGLYCFARGTASAESAREATPAAAEIVHSGVAEAESLLQSAGLRAGWCLVTDVREGSLVAALLQHSKLSVVAVCSHEERAAAVRRKLDSRGAFATHRLAVVAGELGELNLPPHFAGLVVSEGGAPPAEAARAHLRPYDGVIAVRRGEAWEVAERAGPLPGAEDWTHEFADAANTLAGGEQRVRAPLGLLWYGGESAHARFYYDGNVDHQSGHGINPQPVPAQVVAGRMILQGPGLLGAVDIYTGRVLWERELPRAYTFGGAGGGLGIHSKKHPEPWRYEEALGYEVKPTEHCRASGFNSVSLEDGIYVAAARRLLRIDPRDGRELASWPVPLNGDWCWGGLRVEGNLLLATAFQPRDLVDAQAGHDGNGGDYAGDRMPMKLLLALDRRTGELQWKREAAWGFINRSGICSGGGRVYLVDLLTDGVLEKYREAGREFPASPPALHALELATGRSVWSKPLEVRVKNIAYSAERDLLLVPCRNLMVWAGDRWDDRSRDIRTGKVNKNTAGRMQALRGTDGSVVWDRQQAAYYDPHIVLNDLIIDRQGFSYNLLTGERHERTSPLSGELETWGFRKGGCNHLIACESMITWRTAYFDLAGQRGVMPLIGMDAGCAPTLLPAGGVLNLPNFGTHHKRNRMTAMALVHRPENPLWTRFATNSEKSDRPPAPLVRGGFNLGARGDRGTEEGLLWLQVTPRNLNGAKLEPKDPAPYEFYADDHRDWIASSGLLGAERITLPTVVPAGAKSAEAAPRRYRVRLWFAEPENRLAGERSFSLTLEGETVLSEFDVVKEAGGPRRPVIKEFPGVLVTGDLEITLTPHRGQTLLGGVELIAE